MNAVLLLARFDESHFWPLIWSRARFRPFSEAGVRFGPRPCASYAQSGTWPRYKSVAWLGFGFGFGITHKRYIILKNR